MIESAIVPFTNVVDRCDVIHRFEVVRVLLHGFPVVALGFRKILRLVIHESKAVQGRRIVAIDRNGIAIFDNRIFVHLAGEERVASSFGLRRRIEIFLRHEHRRLDGVPFNA